MTARINAQKAITFLEQAVKEKGADYRYPKDEFGGACQYEYDGAPACIVGYVFNYEGLLDPNQNQLVAENSGISEGPAHFWDGTDNPIVDYQAAFILAAAQDLQDNEETWGDAVDAAKERADFIARLRNNAPDWAEKDTDTLSVLMGEWNHQGRPAEFTVTERDDYPRYSLSRLRVNAK